MSQLTDPTAVVPRKKKLVKRPPARKQVEQQIIRKQPEQTGSTFNVWYGKWAGGDKYDEYQTSEKAPTRVDVKRDAGYTRADAGGTPYLCLFFARGSCPYGVECNYLHRLPPKSNVLPDVSLDVFGRNKHSDYRDDMAGAGSFNRQNRTLYIGRIQETRDTAEMVERHFEEFGEIERIKILQTRGVAFVTYTNELNAQFAKEAMMNQSLDSDEILNVRWATEDPNPAAIRAEAKRLNELGKEGVAAKLDPKFVEAVRQLDELEGIVPPREEHEEEFPQIEAPPLEQAKRPRQEEDEQAVAKKAREEEPAKGGLFSASALSNLKLLADMGKGAAAPPPPPAAKAGGLSGLADYGSDSEED